MQARKLYTGKTNDSLLMHSLSSIEDFQEYLKYLMHTALDYRDFAAQPKSVVKEIKQYIHAHYGEDLSRNELAEIVYLHPDYLARLFKREVGLTPNEYKRMVCLGAESRPPLP